MKDTQTIESSQASSNSVYELYAQKLKPSKEAAKQSLAAKEAFYKDTDDFLNILLCNRQLYYEEGAKKKLKESTYNKHSVVPANDADRKHFSGLFQEMRTNGTYKAESLNLNLRESRGLGAVLGMAIGDALGASTQFISFEKKGLGLIKEGFYDIHQAILSKKIHERSGRVGIWTDDASMGLSMADSILLTDYNFDPTHIRYMFAMWLDHGLNNGGRPYSIGLGGNISISMYQFAGKQQDFTEEGHRFNNGNGSLMRLAPVPVAFSDDVDRGVFYSGLSSLTTHNGVEAQECARLMGNIIIELINRGEGEDGKEVLLRVCDNFKSPVKSVQFLARGQCESQQHFQHQKRQNPKFQTFNKSLQDRNWNWRSQSHTYSPTRLSRMPGYIGSYCMDGFSMALHTVIFSKSFKEVVIWNADMGGDCDTVGSIAGQIAGAMYGVNDGMMKLYSEMEDFRCQRYDVFLKGYKIAQQKKLVLEK